MFGMIYFSKKSGNALQNLPPDTVEIDHSID